MRNPADRTGLATEMSDEMLMAYVDRVLGPQDSAKVELAIKEDPALRARLVAFEATLDTIGDAFRPIANEPVPHHLVELVRRFPVASATDGRHSPGRLPVAGAARRQWHSLPVASWRASMAMAASLVIAAVLGAGADRFLSRAGTGPSALAPSAFLVAESGRIRAAGGLQRALDTSLSGTRAAFAETAGKTAQVEPKLTYKSGDTYCRQYELVDEAGRQFTGIGCRERDGNWTVHLHVPVAGRQSPAGRINVAGTQLPAAVLAYIDHNMDAALDSGRERELIGSKWLP